MKSDWDIFDSALGFLSFFIYLFDNAFKKIKQTQKWS